MKVVKPSDFEPYFTSKTDRIVAAESANAALEKILRRHLEDPTRQAPGQYAKGYREALLDLKAVLLGDL